MGEALGKASPPTKNPIYSAFEEYEEVPKLVPLDFMEDDITWVAGVPWLASTATLVPWSAPEARVQPRTAMITAICRFRARVQRTTSMA